MASLTYASMPQFYGDDDDHETAMDEPDCPKPSAAYMAQLQAANAEIQEAAAYADRVAAGAALDNDTYGDVDKLPSLKAELEMADLAEFRDKPSSDAPEVPSSNRMASAVPGMLWAEDYCCYGRVTKICIGAWFVFVAVPLLFFAYVRGHPLPPTGPSHTCCGSLRAQPLNVASERGSPPPQVEPQFQAQLGLGDDLLGPLMRFGLILWLLCALCFVATGMVNPGVPPAPATKASGMIAHPGTEYTISRDTNRYVKGFDHFCEFVGNDIGRGNLGCFVTFLVLLTTLATYVAISSGWDTVLLWLPPSPQYHLLTAVWRWVLAAVLVLLLAHLVFKCWKSDACAGIGPLIMLMPGAHVGAVLIVLVFIMTIFMPFLSDMLAGVSPAANPIAFFLVLPCLCFAVLFWGMSIHWVWLLAEGTRPRGHVPSARLATPSHAATALLAARDMYPPSPPEQA